MPASSTKLPEKALKIVPLVKKNNFQEVEKNNSMNLDVAEKTEDKVVESQQIYLVNRKKDSQTISVKPSQESFVDEALDLSAKIKVTNDVTIPRQKKLNSDGGWEFLKKLSKFSYKCSYTLTIYRSYICLFFTSY